MTKWEDLPGHELSDEEFLEEFYLYRGGNGVASIFRCHDRPTWNLYVYSADKKWLYWNEATWVLMENERMRRRLIAVAFPEVVE